MAAVARLDSYRPFFIDVSDSYFHSAYTNAAALLPRASSKIADRFCEIDLSDTLDASCIESLKGDSFLDATRSSLDDSTVGHPIDEDDPAPEVIVHPLASPEANEVMMSTVALTQSSTYWRSSDPPIQLTGWRMRDEDGGGSAGQSPAGEAAGSHLDVSEAQSNGDGVDTSGNGYQRMAPEDLPRMFPAEWTFGMPFIFDEQMDDETKGCCGYGHFTHSTFVRWFIGVISLIGLACVIVGVVLGALTMSGSTRLTLCLLMIGVGVVLITVSGLAWRLLSLETSQCLPRSSCLPTRAALVNSLQRRRATSGSDGRPHSRISYSRVCRRRPISHQYFADVFQTPEFVWRPPPPTYQTAVRERRWRNSQRREVFRPPAGSPPPTYRSRGGGDSERARPSVVAQIFRTNSRPPSYSTSLDAPQHIPMSIFAHSSELPPPGPSSLPPPYRASTPIATPTVATPRDPVIHDDRASLVRNEAAASHWAISTVSNRDRRDSDSIGGDRLTIIDCSEPVPVGFELRRGRRWPSRFDRPMRAPRMIVAEELAGHASDDVPLERYRYV